jgi:hypothetical protein
MKHENHIIQLVGVAAVLLLLLDGSRKHDTNQNRGGVATGSGSN